MRRYSSQFVRQGYTLLEVLVVMAIIVLMTAIAYPTLEAMYGNVRMTAAVDQIRGQWGEARAQAIDDGQAYRFSMMAGQGKFRLAPDLPEFWSGGDTSGLMDGEALVVEDHLPKGVEFSAGNSGATGDWQQVVVFMPDGSCKEDAELMLTAKGLRSVNIRIRGLTAVATVTTLKREGR